MGHPACVAHPRHWADYHLPGSGPAFSAMEAPAAGTGPRNIDLNGLFPERGILFARRLPMLRLVNILSAMASAISSMVLLSGVAAGAQSGEPSSAGSQIPAITVRSNLVLVPALVKTKSGELVFSLTADDFILTDNGVPQSLRLEPDTDAQPLALAVIVQTGGRGASHLGDYRDLDAVLDAVVGNVPHRVAVVTFDSKPRLEQDFTTDTDAAARPLPTFRRAIRARPFLTRSTSASIFCASSRQTIAVPCCFSARRSTTAAKPASRMPYARSTTPTPRFIASAFRARKWR